ncbi:MAG TPA: response regulator, partial [Dyadobacter sp.]|nr:response regulator [Dyadobacter sp.]
LEAANGLEAVEHCKRVKPDLIFMDIQMPEMNGYEATFAIRNLFHSDHVPIIALTAGNVKGERDKCLDAGMDDFVAKPFVEESLRKIILNHTQPAEIIPEVSAPSETSIKHFDIEMIRATYMNDQEFISEFLTLIEESLKAGLSDLNQHYENQDLSALKSAAHKLKGAAASAYMQVITEITHELEYLNNFDQALVRGLLDKMEAEYQLLIPLITPFK